MMLLHRRPGGRLPPSPNRFRSCSSCPAIFCTNSTRPSTYITCTLYAVRWLGPRSGPRDSTRPRWPRSDDRRPRSHVSRVSIRSYVYVYGECTRTVRNAVDLLYRYRYRIGKINPSLSALSSLFLLVSTGAMVHSINYLDTMVNLQMLAISMDYVATK